MISVKDRLEESNQIPVLLALTTSSNVEVFIPFMFLAFIFASLVTNILFPLSHMVSKTRGFFGIMCMKKTIHLYIATLTHECYFLIPTAHFTKSCLVLCNKVCNPALIQLSSAKGKQLKRQDNFKECLLSIQTGAAGCHL